MPLPAAACTVGSLAPLEGQWLGQGNVQADEDAALEGVACRLVFSSPEPGTIVTRGVCATATETRDVGGYLRCEHGRLEGPLLASSGEPEPRLINGDVQDGQISLDLEGPHPTRGDTVRFRLQVILSGPDEMRMRVTRGGLIALNIGYTRE